MRYESITDAIGGTPLVAIPPEVHGLVGIDLYAKLEMLNPFGSVKDRAAWNMARERLDDARRDAAAVVELSSGNTAKALAVIAGMHGLPFRSVTNRMKVPEIKDLLLLLGAQIEELPGQTECLDPTDTEEPLTRMYRRLTEERSEFLHTDQYFNPLNRQAHQDATGPEIVADLDGRVPDYFIACVGTAGSSTGVARALRARGAVGVWGVVADRSDFIPGIRTADELTEVGLFDPDTFDRIDSVTSQQAIDGMLVLNRRCGILGGPTAGAAYFAAVRALGEVEVAPGERKTAVFIVCDRVESYMSYVRQRRPELLQRPARANDVRTVSEDEVAQVRSLSVAEAAEWIERERPVVIDLRGSFAFRALHLAGSINIVDEVFGELAQDGIPVSPQQPVLLVCPVGEQSLRYAALLKRLGHRDARSLAGGVVAWRDAGQRLVSA
ncbi:MAG: pyridoxal-phosphate dependent enzyme [Micropruina sp.]|uniref:pyridoxal-phosphate dependent enzyme n=1 Tax=Micropruina sp. TaxID=2737536 RepID=UPI0039E239D9